MPDWNATGMPAYTAGRYGGRREPRRARPWLAVLLATLILAGATVLALRLYLTYGEPPHAGRVLAETDRTDTAVTVRFEVRSRADDRPVTCRLRARGFDGAVVGSAEVVVPAGRRVVQTYTLPTRARAALVDIPGCRAAPLR